MEPRPRRVDADKTWGHFLDIDTVQLWNYNKLICLEAALLSEDETPTDHDVQ